MMQVSNSKNYVYTFIRTDLPIEQQIVQAAHSALEAGRDLGKPDSHSHLVLLRIKSETALKNAAKKLEDAGIRFSAFYEPDYNRGYTSITTEPLTEDSEKRKHFSKYSLYKFDAEKAFGFKDEQFN